MYRLCLTSVVLLALGTGASLAQDASTSAADNVATIDSAAPTALDSSSTADSTSNPNAEPSRAIENDAQSAPATKRSTRRHTVPAPTQTVETAPTKTVEIKDLGERTVCEEVGLPGSRIVVGKRCRTYNIHDRSDMKMAEDKKEQTKQTLTDLRRMQDNLEREQRQQEWNRERAVAALVMGAH
jgi:hypothetical protein